MKVSPSKLKVYVVCGLQYKYQYELKLLQPTNPAFAIGTAYHKMLENYYHGIMPTEVTPNPMLLKYQENPVDGNVVDTEKKIEFQFENIEIVMILDRLDEDKIVEYKTSSFNYKPEDVDNWQTDLNIWVMYKLTGRLYPMHYSVMNKKRVTSKKYKPQIIVVEKTLQDMIDIEERLLEVVSRIEAKDFKETIGPHCWYCPFGIKGTGNCDKFKYKKK